MNSTKLCALALMALSLAACSTEKKAAPGSNVTTAAAEVTVHQQLVNAIHNYENLSKDDRLTLVTELVKKGADVNTTNELGEPILGDAVHFASGKSVDSASGKSVDSASGKSVDSASGKSESSGDGQYDDIRVVRLLVEQGADVNAVGKTHRSPLTKAAETGNIEVLELFFQNKLEINNENGTRALVKAAYMEHKNVVEMFLAHGFQADRTYAEALTADDMYSEETKAAAALFGAYVDDLNSELQPLLGRNGPGSRNVVLSSQLSNIAGVCKQINEANAIEDNMKDYFNRTEECSVMGRLGALAYMQCYGLQRSNSANLQRLQNQLSEAAGRAHGLLKLDGVNFSRLTSSQELLGYDNQIRAAMAVYQDVLLPAARAHRRHLVRHGSRNRELQQQARRCQNDKISGGATSIAGSLNAILSDQATQIQGFTSELALLEKMRAKIAYQLPALNSTEVLRLREIEAAKKKNTDGTSSDTSTSTDTATATSPTSRR